MNTDILVFWRRVLSPPQMVSILSNRHQSFPLIEDRLSSLFTILRNRKRYLKSNSNWSLIIFAKPYWSEFRRYVQVVNASLLWTPPLNRHSYSWQNNNFEIFLGHRIFPPGENWLYAISANRLQMHIKGQLNAQRRDWLFNGSHNWILKEQ